MAGKLGSHPALDDLSEEAADPQGQVSELTRQQVELALTAAARKDDAFGHTVTDLVRRFRAVEQGAGVSIVAGAGSTMSGNVLFQLFFNCPVFRDFGRTAR